MTTCSIRHPIPCQKPAVYGYWCEEHDPYRCYCGKHATNIVAFSTYDTDGDAYYCDEHLAERESLDSDAPLP